MKELKYVVAQVCELYGLRVEEIGVVEGSN